MQRCPHPDALQPLGHLVLTPPWMGRGGGAGHGAGTESKVGKGVCGPISSGDSLAGGWRPTRSPHLKPLV